MQPLDDENEWFTLMALSQLLQMPYVKVLDVITLLAQDEKLKIRKPLVPGQNWEWRLHCDALPMLYHRLYGSRLAEPPGRVEQYTFVTMPLSIDEPETLHT